MAVELVDYDPAWAREFAREKRLLEEVLAPCLHGGIHHVGSTAIPGMFAKPIIDVLAGVASLHEARLAVPALAEVEYLYWSQDPNPWRLWFLKPEPTRRTHHLHLIESQHPQFAAKLAFRDELRRDEELRHEYARLKRRLASAHPNDRDSYTASKGDFVLIVLREAGVTHGVDPIQG